MCTETESGEGDKREREEVDNYKANMKNNC